MINKLNDTELIKISGGTDQENEYYAYFILDHICSYCCNYIHDPEIRLIDDNGEEFLFCSEECLQNMGFVPIPGWKYTKDDDKWKNLKK